MLSRVVAPAVSPDGQWLVWQQRETDLAADKGRLRSVAARPDRPRAPSPRSWSPSPRSTRPPAILAPTARRSISSRTRAARTTSGRSRSTGGAPTQVTDLKGGFGGFKVAPTGDKLLIWADRKPGAPSERAGDGQEGATMPAAAAPIDQLFIRHWDTLGRRRALAIVRDAAGRRQGHRATACDRGRAGRRHAVQAVRRRRGSGVERGRQDRLSSRCARRGGSSRSRPISTSSPRPRTDRPRRPI